MGILCGINDYPLCPYYYGKTVGMVLAGVAIGKYGLHILERDTSFELFGKVGLYYILFLAALEMDIEGLKKNKFRFVIFGFVTFLLPFFLTFYSSLYLLSLSPTTSLLMACIMSSHTLIGYPIVSRFGLQRKTPVMLAVGSTMISLLMALLVLAGHLWTNVLGSIFTQVCTLLLLPYARNSTSMPLVLASL